MTTFEMNQQSFDAWHETSSPDPVEDRHVFAFLPKAAGVMLSYTGEIPTPQDKPVRVEYDHDPDNTRANLPA